MRLPPLSLARYCKQMVELSHMYLYNSLDVVQIQFAGQNAVLLPVVVVYARLSTVKLFKYEPQSTCKNLSIYRFYLQILL